MQILMNLKETSAFMTDLASINEIFPIIDKNKVNRSGQESRKSHTHACGNKFEEIKISIG